jgi:hypothetical protein
MAADLAFLTRLHGPQHDAVPCAKTRCRSRTEEARGSNPLTSTPNLAGQSVASVERAALSPFRGRAGAASAHENLQTSAPRRVRDGPQSDAPGLG